MRGHYESVQDIVVDRACLTSMCGIRFIKYAEEIRIQFRWAVRRLSWYDLGFGEVSACVLVTQSCPALWDPVDCSPPGFSIHETLQARILEWVVIPFSRGSSQPRYWTWVSHIVGRLLSEPTGKSFELPYDPAIPLLGIHSEKIIPKDTCNPVFTAALFTKVRTWKQPKCQSTDEWIKSMSYTYIYIIEYYSPLKKNKPCHLQRCRWT